MTLRSNRGIPLVVQGSRDLGETGLLTVELYEKWYCLYRVDIDRNLTIKEVQFHELEQFARPGQSAFVDHIPNPACVWAYAEHYSLVIPVLAEELIEGRWCLNIFNNQVIETLKVDK